MKRCPQCGRDYTDDTLSFCLDDGTSLLDGPASANEPQTAILHTTEPPSEAETKHLIHLTDSSEEPPPENQANKNQVRKRKYAIGGVLFLIVLTLASSIAYFKYFSVPETEEIDSIAVMPFITSEKGTETDYLADGLTESIIYNLSRIEGLKVLPSSTVFTLKGKPLDASKIGSELGVRAVLLSRLAVRDGLIDISTELIDARENKVIWGEKYSRKSSDALALQKEISNRISDSLRTSLSGGNRVKLEKSYTSVPEAYQEYLKGRYQIERRTKDGIESGIANFERAVELDPNWALAWSGLADAYLLEPQYSQRKLPFRSPKALSAAKKAVALGPDLAEAHTSLGANLEVNFRWEEAEASYRSALEIDPKYATTHHWYALLLIRVGRKEEALYQMRKALELEPLSLIINRNLGQVLILTGRYKEGREQLRKTMQLNPDFPMARTFIGISYLYEKDYAKAVEMLELAVEKGDIASKGDVIAAYALSGQELEARNRLADLISDENSSSFDKAIAYISLGEKDKALEFLEEAFESGDRQFSKLRVNPLFDSVRDDPRYKALIEKLEFPE